MRIKAKAISGFHDGLSYYISINGFEYSKNQVALSRGYNTLLLLGYFSLLEAGLRGLHRDLFLVHQESCEGVLCQKNDADPFKLQEVLLNLDLMIFGEGNKISGDDKFRRLMGLRHAIIHGESNSYEFDVEATSINIDNDTVASGAYNIKNEERTANRLKDFECFQDDPLCLIEKLNDFYFLFKKEYERVLRSNLDEDKKLHQVYNFFVLNTIHPLESFSKKSQKNRDSYSQESPLKF